MNNNRNREILTIPLEDGYPISVDWSPDGTRLVVGESTGGVQVFAAEGKPLWRCNDHYKYVHGVRWAPNGQRIASASIYSTIRVFDAVSGKVLLRCYGGIGNMKITWSPDNSSLAWYVEEGDSKIVRIVNASTGQPLLDCSGHSMIVQCVSWSPTGNVLASGSADKTIRLWDTTTGFCLFCLVGHNRDINDLCWSPDGGLIASASDDKTVRVWNTKTGDCLYRCVGHESGVWSVSWSPDGGILASGSADNSVCFWSANSGTPLLQLNEHTVKVSSVAFSPVGNKLACVYENGNVRILDTSGLVQVKDEETPDTSFRQYITLQAATIGIYPPTAKVKTRPWVPHLPEAEGYCLGVLKGPNAGSQFSPKVDIFPDGMSIATGHSDGFVRCWNLKTGKILWETTDSHNGNVSDISISQDGKRIASSSTDSTVRIWDATNGDSLKILKGHKKQVLRVCWSPDGHRLASIEYSQNKQIRIWDTITGKCIHILEGHETWGRGVRWSPDGLFVSSWDEKDCICIWDPESGQCLNILQPYKGGLKALCWSPVSKHILIGYHDSKIFLMDAMTGSIDSHYDGHTVGISTLKYSHDGKFFASGADIPFVKMGNQTISVCDVNTGKLIKDFNFEEQGCSNLSWSPDNGFIVSSHDNDVFRIWDTRSLLYNKIETAVEPSLAKSLPENLKHLPAALAQMLRLNIYPPLSLVRDLLDLLANRCTIETLQTLSNQAPGIKTLRDLHWPFDACIGLGVLLLHNYPPSQWKPPQNITPTEVRNALKIALSGESIDPQPPAPPISILTQAAEIIDDRLLSLLSMLGPDAVAADPGLPLRLLSRIKEIPPLSISQRRQLGIRINTPGVSGQSTGLAPGADHGQTGDIQMGPLRSDFTSLLPTQLALPPLVKMYRHLRNELLFRAREMAEPPRMRPAVILLDVSPSTFGVIEKITRLAAFTVAQSLRRAGLSAILLTNSDGIKEGQWLLELNHPADLVEIWLQRTLKSIPASRSLELARVLRAGMQENDGLEPIILVLSHPWYGADEEIPPIKNMRGLFIQFPNYPTVPALSNQCEKWKTVEATQVNDLTSILAQLIT